MNKSIKKYFLASIIGSSIYATMITFSYTGKAYKTSGKPKDIPFELLPLIVPSLFGLMNIINIYIQENINLKFKGKNYLISGIVGAIAGLIFSFIGRFGLNLPTKMFQFTEKNEWQVHIIAAIMYAIIFTVIIQPTNEYILYPCHL